MTATRPAASEASKEPADGTTRAALRLRRLDLAAVAAGDPAARADRRRAWSAAAPFPTRPSAKRSGRRSADVRARGDAAVRDANARGRRWPPGRPPDPRSVRPSSRPRPAGATSAPGARPGDRPRPALRRNAAPEIDARPRSRRASRSSAAGRRWPGSAPTSRAARRRIRRPLVMTVVPAQVAGVDEVVVASPADRDGRDEPDPARCCRAARGRRVHRRRRRPGDRCPRVRAAGSRHRSGRPDRRSRQCVGHRGQDRGLRRGRHRPAGRAVGRDGPRCSPGRSGPRGRRPHHAGRTRAGLPGHPRDHGPRLRRRRGGGGRSPRSPVPAAPTS